MPTTDAGKAIASRNATSHGLFSRDVVLPSLGEDPEGYRQLQAEWLSQLAPRTLLDHHYVEKIAAASWRLRRLHRWQAQLFEDASLTEGERIDRLDKVLRHETALHRQIDTAVKMLSKEAPALYRQRVREQVLQDTHIAERECRENAEDETMLQLEMHNRMYRIQKATAQAINELSVAPLDNAGESVENCQNELPPAEETPPADAGEQKAGDDGDSQKCQNELAPSATVPLRPDPCRINEFLDPDYRHRPLVYPAFYPAPLGKGRRERRR